MNTKRVLFEVPTLSMYFERTAYLDWSGPLLTVRYEFTRDNLRFAAGFGFRLVSAMKMFSEDCCTEWNLETAYDALVEVDDSSWIAEMRPISRNRRAVARQKIAGPAIASCDRCWKCLSRLDYDDSYERVC